MRSGDVEFAAGYAVRAVAGAVQTGLNLLDNDRHVAGLAWDCRRDPPRGGRTRCACAPPFSTTTGESHETRFLPCASVSHGGGLLLLSLGMETDF